jgi:hypothetical protein
MNITLDPKILWGFLSVLTLIAIKTLLTWIIAWKAGEFDIREAPRFLITNVLPYCAALAVLAIPSLWMPEISTYFLVIVGLVDAKYLTEIKDRISAFFEITAPEDIAS